MYLHTILIYHLAQLIYLYTHDNYRLFNVRAVLCYNDANLV